MTQKELLNASSLHIILNRLACQLIENHGDFSQTVLIGLQPRGVFFLEKIIEKLKENGAENLRTGEMDITFFRDDFRRRTSPLSPNKTRVDHLLENQKVVFVDDVLYTGRSVRSALDAVHSFGRPAEIELMVLIDRRFSRQLPIQPDYTGKRVDSLASQRVKVQWAGEDGAKSDTVFLLKPEE